MVLFPNCKVNLGLHITAKRKDGYHDLETIFLPVAVKDVLEIIPSANFQFHILGLPVPGEQGNNLCVKAYQLLKKDFGDLLPPADIWLYKQIPMGAGLGGGSSDGAYTLKGLSDLFRLELGPEKLQEYAARLGSDCPFFLVNRPCYATGRGEILEPLDLDLSAYCIAFIHPGIHVNTAWAFSQLKPAPSARPVRDILKQPVATWKEELTNDFEIPVTRHYPALSGLKERLYAAGAVYAAMTGSGSSFYGIFEKDKWPPEGPGKEFQVAAIGPGSLNGKK